MTLKLHSSKQLSCFSELFHKKEQAFNRSFYDENFSLEKKTWLGSKKMGLKALFEYRAKDFKSFLQLVFSSNAYPVGFKIFPGQHPDAMEQLIADKDIRKIFLIREDMLRNFVSYKLALTTGKWDRVAGQKAELQKIEIDPAEFLDYADVKLDAIEALVNKCEQLGQTVLQLTYEEITDVLPTQKIERFLEVDLSDLETEVDRKKQNPFKLQEMVTNFDELEKALKGTRWEQFLTENA